MTQVKNTGFGRIIKAVGYSWDGLKTVYRSEAAFRQEIALFIPATFLLFWLEISPLERALLLGALFFVLITEILNTAIEVAINRISTEIHPLSKQAKDLASAAVFLALANAAALWAIILLPHFFAG